MLRHRMKAVTGHLAGLTGDLHGVDIVAPVAPGTSPIGLTLWHVPRAQDWLMNTSIRGVPEVVDRHHDGLPDPERFGFGTGLTPDWARDAAATVELPRLLEYATAVRDEVDAWLATLSTADLDAVPPFAAHQAARAAYVTAEARADVEHLDGLTTGDLLLRPGLSHLFVHLGEVGALMDVARSRAA